MDRRAGARARPEAVGARWVALVGTVGAQRARTVAAGAAIEQEIGVVVVDGDGSAFTPRGLTRVRTECTRAARQFSRPTSSSVTTGNLELFPFHVLRRAEICTSEPPPRGLTRRAALHPPSLVQRLVELRRRLDKHAERRDRACARTREREAPRRVSQVARCEVKSRSPVLTREPDERAQAGVLLLLGADVQDLQGGVQVPVRTSKGEKDEPENSPPRRSPAGSRKRRRERGREGQDD